MEKIILVRPNIKYSNQIKSYRQEFIDNNEHMDGSSLLINYEDVKEWIKATKRGRKQETVQKGWVPADAYLAIRKSDHYLLGMIDVRHYLNDFLLQLGGHIGYSVRASERRKGYAKEMLRLALIKCKKMKFEKVLVTCFKNNIASAKTILANGGVLENEVTDEDGITQRYWIKL